MQQNENNLIWIDLEMTGLDPDTDCIIEIATIITDSQLNVLEEGPMIAIHQPEAVMDKMDAWNTKQHGNSGLTERVKNSKYTETQAQQETIDFLTQYVMKGKSPMCGNSICQDRRFLYRCMRPLEEYFHYRNLDVSTLKELARRWAPDVYNNFKKQGSHLAMDDIRESINEMKYYREHIMKC